MIPTMVPHMVKSIKLASMSAMVTSVLLTQAEMVSVFQPTGQPAQAAQPTTSTGPRRVVRQGQPAQPASAQPTTGAQTTTDQAGTGAAKGQTLPIFTPASSDAAIQLQRTAEMLAKMEQDLAQTNQKLLNQLGQARMATGEQHDQRMAEVLQGILQEQEQIRKYLVDLRLTVTGNQGTTQAAATEQEGERQPSTTTGGGTTNTSPRR